MAIHIDIYAHLRKQQLIKEGEQLKRYVESLEGDIGKSQERNAKSRSAVLTKLADQQARFYNSAINSADSYTSALKREKDAEEALAALKKTKKKDIADEEKHLKKLAAAEQELTSATKDRTYQAQQLDAATRSLNQSNDNLAKGNAEHTKNARQVGALLTANTKRFTAYSAATNQARRQMESLHSANAHLVKDNASVARSIDRVTEASERRAAEDKKLKEMVKDGVSDYGKLRAQSDRLKKAYKDEGKAIAGVTGDLQGLSKQHQLSRVVVDANQHSLRSYAKTAVDARREIKDLSTTHAQAIAGNAKLARSFETAGAAAKSAMREHKEYKKMIRDGADQDALVKKLDRVNDAYERQRKEAAAARDGLSDLLRGQQEATSFVRSQDAAMRNYAAAAIQARDSVDHLRAAHQHHIRDSAALTRSFNAVGLATKKATDAAAEYDRLVARGASRDDLEKQAKKVSEAYQDQAQRADEATEALKRNSKERTNNRIRGLTGGIGEYTSRNVNALLPGGRLNTGVMLPLAAIAGSMAEAGVTASQSLALLPALGAAGAAAIGTLTIGMHGFIDTVGDMADPKKFAEGLALLSPNAQQAAIEIKNLVDGPLGDLKALVQDNLFANLAPQIHALAGEFGPELSQLFGGLATEMNQAFMGVTNVLMTPESQASIGATIDSMIAGFQHLTPGLGQFTQGVVKLVEVGSTFLPQIGDLFTDLMTRFNNLVQRTSADGSLQEFIQKGIDATRYLIDFVITLGKEIYAVFGNTSVDEFRNTLDTVREVIMDIAKAIAGLARLFNAVMPALDGIADAIGGWDVVMAGFVAWWAGGALSKPIMAVARLLGMGKGGVGAALSALPGTANTAATGVSAALAKIKIPPALAKILGVTGVAAAAAAVVGGAASAAGVGHEGVTERKSGSVDWFPDAINPGVIFNPNNWIDNALGKFDTPTGVPGTPGAPAPMKSGPGLGGTVAPWNTAPAAPGSWFPQPVPTHTEPGDFQSTPGTFELANIPVGQFAGAQWNVPQGVTDLPPDYDNIGKTGYYQTDPMDIMQETADAESARVTAEEKRKKYLAVLADVEHTQDDVAAATQDVIDAEQNYLQSIRAMKEAERGEFQDLTSQMDDFGSSLKDALGGLGVALDDDLGISDGLAGLAENAVKFFATLGAAPVLGAMKGMQAGLGYPGNKDNGSGLVGIAGALSGYYNAPSSYKDQAELANAQAGVNAFGLSTVTPSGPVQSVPAGAGAEGWRQVVGETVAKYGPAAGVPPNQYQNWTDAIVRQIDTESGGRQGAQNPNDSNGAGGKQHVSGLLQYLPSTYANTGGKLTGLPFMDPVGQIAGALADHRNAAGGPATMGRGSGWSPPGFPSSAPIMSGAPIPAAASSAYVAGVQAAQDVAMPSILKDTGSVGSGPQSRTAAALIQQLFGSQLRGTIGGSRDNNTAKNTHDAGLSIDIPIGADQMQLGDQINSWLQENAGSLGLKYSIWRDKGVYPGTGGKTGFTAGGHQNHIDAHFDGKGGTGMPVMGVPGGVPGLAGAAPGGGVPGLAVPSGSGTPVFVTNWPGGGAFGGGGTAGGGIPGAPMGAGPAGGTPHAGSGAPAGPGGPSAPGRPGTSGGPGVANRNAPVVGPAVPAAGGNFLPAWRNAIGATPAHGVQGVDPGAALLNGLGQPLTVPTGLSGDDMLAWLKQNPNHVLPGGGGPSSLPAIDNIANNNVPGAGVPGTNPLDVFAPTMQSLWNPLTSPAGPASNGEVPIIAHSGEHMLTSKDVSAMGGQQGVYDFRNALHYEGGGAIDQILGGVTGTSTPPGTGTPKAAPGALPSTAAKDYLKTLTAPPAGSGPTNPMTAPLGSPAVAPPAVPPGAAPAGPGAPAVPGVPGVPHSGTGASPGPAPVLTPGGIATPGGVATQGTTIGANPDVDPDTGYGEGLTISGGAIGALTGAASGAASMAADAFAPGSGAAASAAMQIGVQEIQRAIEFGAQAVGIGIQGIQQTFLPSGGSELANNSWLTRAVGGIVGAAPALANVAGGAAQGQPLGQGANLPGVGPATAEQLAAQGPNPSGIQHTGAGAPGPVSNTGVNIENYITADNRAASQDFGRYALPGAR